MEFPKVILSANVSHYYYTALALQKANFLRRYICAITIRNSEHWLVKRLPDYWQKKLKGRDITGIGKEKVVSLWLPETLQRSLPKIGLLSAERANWLNDITFDLLATQWIDNCDIFHFVSGIGLNSAKKARIKGGITICDIRTSYPGYQHKILIEEYDLLGVSNSVPAPSTLKRAEQEFQISDYFIVPSQFAKRTFVEAGYDPKKVYVVPYGVDLSHFFIWNSGLNEGTNVYSENKFTILFVGQIIARKGVHYLIEAFNNLGLKDAQLLLIGDIEPSMVEIIKKAITRNQGIQFLGQVPKIDLFKLYNSASVLVLPSLEDSWGLVVTEAMACGLPVIVSENTGSCEIVQDYKNGFTVPIRDPGAIEERLLYLYKNRDSCYLMGKTARSIIESLTWDTYGESLLDAYHSILI